VSTLPKAPGAPMSAYTLHWSTKADVVARIECEHPIALVLTQGLADYDGCNVDLVHEATGEIVKIECEGVRMVREVREEHARAYAPLDALLSRLTPSERERVRKELVTGEPSGVTLTQAEEQGLLRAAIDEGVASGDPIPHDEVFARLRAKFGWKTSAS